MSAQSIDDLNIQFHGYATQGFLYSTQNNLFTTSSSNGSPAWTEAPVRVMSPRQFPLKTPPPQPKKQVWAEDVGIGGRAPSGDRCAS